MISRYSSDDDDDEYDDDDDDIVLLLKCNIHACTHNSTIL